MDRLFLDANVIVSAALTAHSRLGMLWTLKGVRLVASPYVIEEARRNVAGPEAIARLDVLIAGIAVLPSEPADFVIEGDPGLPAKDRPVLLGAIASGSTCLLTGDMSHFSDCYGRSSGGVTVLLPGEYLRTRASDDVCP
jgi:predicted nucleic acid-binding protein